MVQVIYSRDKKIFEKQKTKRESTGLVDLETWIKDKGSYADGIGYTGQNERLLMEVSSAGLEENLDHTLGDSLKLL
ncbi:hypothetical protein BD560DRAFT_432111 [Blakeslea trispora]|nr:hypothetical protein BD560DRAFT_432111 [Blakeslea trispora]